MCGILGVYHEKDYSLSLDKFSALLDDIHYRGPDASGSEEFSMEDGVIKFGHKRLSILDISDAAVDSRDEVNVKSPEAVISGF